MSQLKTHQLAYREHERKSILSDLNRAALALEDLHNNPPDDLEKAALVEGRIEADIRRFSELLATLDKRVARLS